MINEKSGIRKFWDGFTAVAVVILAVALVVGGLMWILPNYGVYRARQAGNAELQQAEFNRQIVVVQAKAEMDAAESKKQAAIIRAEGIAQANKIINESITPLYIEWLWVDGLNEGNNKNQIIYVPSNGLLPTFNFNEGPRPVPGGK